MSHSRRAADIVSVEVHAAAAVAEPRSGWWFSLQPSPPGTLTKATAIVEIRELGCARSNDRRRSVPSAAVRPAIDGPDLGNR